MAKIDEHETEEDQIVPILNFLQSSSTAFQTIGSLDTKGNYEVAKEFQTLQSPVAALKMPHPTYADIPTMLQLQNIRHLQRQ